MTSADITRELRAAKPQAGPELRERVHAIAAAEPPRHVSPVTRLGLRRRTLFVALPAAAALAAIGAGVVGLTDGARRETTSIAAEAPATEGFRQDGTSQSPPATASGDPLSAAGAVESAKTGRATAEQAAPSPDAARAQRYSATLTLEVKDTKALSDATQKAIGTTRSLGGHIVSVSYGAAQTGSASLTLRVPTARVQDAIARLNALGTILSQQVQIDDLQPTLDEAQRRAATLRQRLATINARLQGTSLTRAQRAELQAERQSLRAELSEVEGRRQAVAAEADLATIQLQLQTEPDESAIPVPPSRFDRAVDDAVQILALEGIVALYALVVVVPLALAGAALWLALRAVGRRQDQRLLASS